VAATPGKWREATFVGADGVVAHTETASCATTPSAAIKVGFADIFFMPQPFLLTTWGIFSNSKTFASLPVQQAVVVVGSRGAPDQSSIAACQVVAHQFSP
jgi:hypothetical protein